MLKNLQVMTLTIVYASLLMLFVITLVKVKMSFLVSKELVLQVNTWLRRMTKQVIIGSVKLLKLIKRKTLALGENLQGLAECQGCKVLQESLDLERERVDYLTKLLTGTVTEESEEVENPEELKKINSGSGWVNQRKRLQARALRDYEAYKKEKENETI